MTIASNVHGSISIRAHAVGSDVTLETGPAGVTRVITDWSFTRSATGVGAVHIGADAGGTSIAGYNMAVGGQYGDRDQEVRLNAGDTFRITLGGAGTFDGHVGYRDESL